MNIENKILEIKKAYKNNKPEECLDILESIAEHLGNESLEDDVLSLHSKLSSVQSIKEDKIERRNVELEVNQKAWELTRRIQSEYLKETKNTDYKDFNQHKTNINNDVLNSSSSLLNIKAKELSSKTTAEEFEDYLNLRNTYAEELSNLGNVMDIPELRDLFTDDLFNRILTKEKLNAADILDINKIRNEADEKGNFGEKSFPWYKRVLIVSALSLTFAKGKKLDSTRLNFLLDFLSDKEKGVWQRVLVGLCLGLHRFQHRIKSYEDITNRLISLQQDIEVQHGLYFIDMILRNELYKKNLLWIEKMPEIDFFEKPQNWFLPFYKKNKVLTDTLENIDIDHDGFNRFLSLPFLNSFKYLFCIGLQQGNVVLNDPNNEEQEGSEQEGKEIQFHLVPFESYISEFYMFYKYFPKQTLQNIFDKQIGLYNTKLENILLNETQKIRMKGLVLHEEKKYQEALIQFAKLQQIEGENDLGINIKMGECYLNKESSDFASALRYFNKAYFLAENKSKIILYIGQCYNKLGNATKALEFLKPLKDNSSFDFNLWKSLGRTYFSLKEYFETDKILKETLLASNIYDENVVELLAISNHELGNYEEAFNYFKKIELDKLNRKQQSQLLSNKGLVLRDLKKYEEALDFLNQALNLDINNSHAFATKGDVFFYQEKYHEAIKFYLKSVINSNSKYVSWVILGFCYIKIKDYQNAIKYLTKAIEKKEESDSYSKRCIAYFESGQLREAREDIEKAISIDNNNGDYYIQLSIIDCKENNIEDFYANLELGLSKEHNNYDSKEDILDIETFEHYKEELRFIELLDKYFPE